ncbi:hypothetical protein BO78DRAFT_419126 [Aspergillus sclerotiicarbonarius CBS 121057]|uniref:Uncharacterized protein n=1 Tax=Aspergillus sclerotiicarbonarius (strain CBS 121057 / IBT 28362) TaxID=1448318 RepID=A0A319EHJ4_ASPSB|nr:hypothetical protein BO78DRAFT_419126 [Aspergillus sclerotiicarbonarius CBS 121057]
MNPYRFYVEKQSRRYPSSVQPLGRFLDDPLADQNACRMGVLEFAPDNSAPAYRDLDPQGLHSILSDGTTPKESLPYGRIVIIEDLSREIVEMLGSLLHIDPLFFASHIGHSRASGDSITASTLKPRRQSFITNHYYRAVTLQGLQESSAQYFRDTNINREIVLLPPAQDGTCNALLQHSCSIFVEHDRTGGWLGLVLVDPSIHDDRLMLRQGSDSKHLPYTPKPCHLFQGGYEDFLDLTPTSEWDPIYSPRRGLFEDLVYCWQTERPTSFNIVKPSTISLAYYPIQIILSEWINSLTALDLHIKHHETIIGSLPDQPNHLPHLNQTSSNLSALMTWHRRIRTFITHITQTHHFLQHQEKTPFDLLQSSETITTTLTQLSSTLSTTLIPTAASLAQLLELKRTESQTFRVNQLTYLAFGFVPLSFVTSLYGMSDDFAPGGKKFWQWFVDSANGHAYRTTTALEIL